MRHWTITCYTVDRAVSSREPLPGWGRCSIVAVACLAALCVGGCGGSGSGQTLRPLRWGAAVRDPADATRVRLIYVMSPKGVVRQATIRRVPEGEAITLYVPVVHDDLAVALARCVTVPLPRAAADLRLIDGETYPRGRLRTRSPSDLKAARLLVSSQRFKQGHVSCPQVPVRQRSR